MKKSIVFCGLLMANIAMLSCGHRPNEAIQMPDAVLASFNASYSDIANVKWTKLSDNGNDVFEADFKKNGKKIEIKYDKAGNIIKQL